MKNEKEVILITGGAQRLGLFNAMKLSEKGYRVVITYKTEREQLEELRAKGIHTFRADFSKKGEIDSLVQRVLDTFSSLRAVVHNASLWYPDSEILEGENGMESFMQLVNVHMFAPFKINYGLRSILEAPSGEAPDSVYGDEDGRALGDIVHMTDFVVHKGSKRHAAYAATKAALENMTLSFAAQFGPKIKVNSIAPALVKFNTWDSEEYRKKAEVKSIMGFEPGEDVACQALSYLLHNPYVTGTCLHLDGGRHLV